MDAMVLALVQSFGEPRHHDPPLDLLAYRIMCQHQRDRCRLPDLSECRRAVAKGFRDWVGETLEWILPGRGGER